MHFIVVSRNVQAVTPRNVIPTQDVIIAARFNTIYARCNKYAKCNNFTQDVIKPTNAKCNHREM